MGQRYVNERIKLYNGHLLEEIEREETSFAAVQIAKMRDSQTEKGKDFLFVLTPNQMPKFDDILPFNYINYSNENADELLGYLSDVNIPVLELREEMRNEGMSHDDAFFVTDHHWMPETGLWAYTKIIETLVGSGVIEPVDSPSLDLSEYNVEIHEKIFLGSFGRRTGIFYAGLDDFSIITPKFGSDISVSTLYNDKVDKHGEFSEVMIDESKLAINFFRASPYIAYGYAEKGLIQYRNEEAPVDMKVLAIGDSFSHVTYIYLPFIFKTCDQIDMRFVEGNFEEYYNEFDPDLVIMLVNPAQVMLENTTYDFFNEYQQ